MLTQLAIGLTEGLVVLAFAAAVALVLGALGWFAE